MKTEIQCLTCYEEIINGLRKHDDVFTLADFDLFAWMEHCEREHKYEHAFKIICKKHTPEGILCFTLQAVENDLEKYYSMRRYCGLEYVKDMFSVLGEVEDNIILCGEKRNV